MTIGVVAALSAAFVLSLGVAYCRERRKGQILERATLALVVVTIAGGFFTLDDQADDIRATQDQVAREGVERRNQVCLSAEREHKAAVDRLRRTYRYIAGLSYRQSRSNLNRAIIAQLPQVESEGRTDVAPDFCDEPGEKAEKLWFRTHGKQGAPPVGLPEPDPKIPQRPAGIPPTR